MNFNRCPYSIAPIFVSNKNGIRRHEILFVNTVLQKLPSNHLAVNYILLISGLKRMLVRSALEGSLYA